MRERKTGKQIVDGFFKSLRDKPELNQNVVNLLVESQAKGRFTKKEIDRGLEEQRKKLLNETKESNS